MSRTIKQQVIRLLQKDGRPAVTGRLLRAFGRRVR